MADVLVFAFFWLARLHRLGGVAALQHLHTRLFIGADDHASLLVEAQRLDIELTDSMRFGLEVWIMAVEPVHAPMRLEVCLLQDAPEAGATHGLQLMLLESRDQIVETPPGGGSPAASAAAHESDRKSTRLNSSHANISYAVFCLK